MSNKQETSFNLTNAVNGAIAGASAGAVLSGAIPHDRNSIMAVALCSLFGAVTNGYLAGRTRRNADIDAPAP